MKVPSSIGKCKIVRRHPQGNLPVIHRPRTRSAVTIWSLPEELLLHLLKGLHVKDLLNMRAVHPYIKELIDNNPTVWSSISLKDAWPSTPNIRHFEKAVENNNLEALVKLGMAYLYNEGFSEKLEGNKIVNNGERAASLFCRVESMTPHLPPFTWLFIRPPWSATHACCKECVFSNMKKYCQKENDPSVSMCVAHIFELLEGEQAREDAVHYMKQGAQNGSSVASYHLWQHNTRTQQQQQSSPDKGGELESIRQLRDIASLGGHLDATLALCKSYAAGKYGGISYRQAAAFVREFVQSAKPTNLQDIFAWNVDITHSMRYILVDWLVEVAGMKDFATLTLHVAINVVDRYLKQHQTTRCRLQLLGVSAMVLCSRFLGKDIITIREAAWLTDNTYKYEDVVRMMGEIVATLRGNIRVVTSLDYLDILSCVSKISGRTRCLADYICEMALLHTELSHYSSSEIAASCVLLSRLATAEEYPWPSQMQDFTGYSVADLTKCTVHIHHKCFMESSLVDHREITLQAVKLRYNDEKFHGVSGTEVMSAEELYNMLGVQEHTLVGSDELSVRFKNTKDLIMSPSRNHPAAAAARSYADEVDREQAGTPTMESEGFEFLNESAMSGYDGDKEDEDDSFLDQEDYDDDEQDLVSLWCADNGVAPLPPDPPLPTFIELFSHQGGATGSSSSNGTVKPPSPQLSRPLSNITIRVAAPPTSPMLSDCPGIPGTSRSPHISLCTGSISLGNISVSANQSGIVIYKDSENSGTDDLHRHSYKTRSQRKLPSNSTSTAADRSALRTLSNEKGEEKRALQEVSTMMQKSSFKRKSTYPIGNENKARVISIS